MWYVLADITDVRGQYSLTRFLQVILLWKVKFLITFFKTVGGTLDFRFSGVIQKNIFCNTI